MFDAARHDCPQPVARVIIRIASHHQRFVDVPAGAHDRTGLAPVPDGDGVEDIVTDAHEVVFIRGEAHRTDSSRVRQAQT
eukprot:1285657-Rhodomonas_salina.6